MVVLDINKCGKCGYMCNAIHFQYNFENWTSNNNDIDKFIQDSQLSAHNDAKKALEWIPYNRFQNINYIAEDKLNKMYRANWINGCINKWSDDNQDWKRKQPYIPVFLKICNNPASITLKFINKVCIINLLFKL
jgi:hypothetical protein